MHLIDKDLVVKQAVRNQIRDAKAAQEILGTWSQEQIDGLVKAVAEATYAKREELAKMAHEETGYGKWQDKVAKNTLASMGVYEEYKDLQTVGVLQRYEAKQGMEAAVPVGVIAALIPSTNPTSTVIFKAMIALKTANAIIFSPHPSAAKCIEATVAVIRQALKDFGAPENAVSYLEYASLEATQELMDDRDTKMILATGGKAMVKAAYSSGTPAIGVGPGNVPCYIEKTADIPRTVERIIASKTFDNGVICASEQSVIVDDSIAETVKEEFIKQGAYFITGPDADKFGKLMIQRNGLMNPAMVGKDAETLGQIAGVAIPTGTQVIISEENQVGRDYPYSTEKLCPVLAFYRVKDWEEGLALSRKVLELKGLGHTLSLHTADEAVVEAFFLHSPVSRVLVNVGSALGAVGATTAFLPSMMLGCGAIGNGSTSDNIGPKNLINIRYLAYGDKEISDL